MKTVDNSLVFYRLPSNIPDEFTTPDWYCYECHVAGDVELCATNGCNRVFHKHCVKSDDAKQKCWDKLNYHKNKFKSKSQAMENCRKRSASETSDNSGSAHPYFNNRGSDSDFDDVTKFCYACRLEKKGIITSNNSNISVEEVNHLLKFAFDRVSTWVKFKLKFAKYKIILKLSLLLRYHKQHILHTNFLSFLLIYMKMLI